MADFTALDGDAAVAMLVSAGLLMESIAASCSSPQTAELNAKRRQKTLMKYVNIGMVQGFVLVGAAAMVAKRPGPIILGGVLAGGGLYWQYRHALKAGMKSNLPGTES